MSAEKAERETVYQAERANRNDHEREAMRRERDEARAGWEHAASRAEYAEAQLDQAQALLRDADPNDIEWIEAKQAFASTPNPTEDRCPTCGNPDRGFIECMDPWHPVREIHPQPHGGNRVSELEVVREQLTPFCTKHRAPGGWACMGTKDHYGDSIVGKRTRTPGEAALDSAEAAMRECLTRYPDYEEFDPLRRVLGLPLYMAPNYRDDLFSTPNPTEGTE